METTFVSTNTNQKDQDVFRTISLTSLLTGTLDITAANIQFYLNTHRGATLKLTGNDEPISFITYLAHGGPGRIFKYIARAVFGDEVNSGGTLMVIWGAVFHYLIAFLFTALLFIIYPKVIRWFKSKFVVAFIYGLFIWAVMSLAVVPISKINKFPPDLKNAIIAELILTFMIGLPVALIAHRFYSRKRVI
jgi:hypothetical protein